MLRIVFFTFYYPPDLCAGSFRAVALAKALSSKMETDDELHIITTHPNRYTNHRPMAVDFEVDGKVVVHRISVTGLQSGMLPQAQSFGVYALSAYRLCRKLSPDFLIGTTSRLMTGILTGVSAFRIRCHYFIDLRDIFSETISDLFSRKNWLLGWVTKHTFSLIERRLFHGAEGVNVVSEEFPNYFQVKGVDISDWSYFPNGVDQEFVNFQTDEGSTLKDVKTILYAGNIGSGQGLDTVLPTVAKQLGDGFKFLIVGGGGKSELLRETIQKEVVSNIKMIPPVGRSKLIDYYRDADILFLHLNDVPAFQRVLPSKIFEYAAVGKPIVAGVGGYSAQFLRDHLPYASLFEPGDSESAYSSIMKAATTEVPRDVVNRFISSYSRKSIMDKMAEHLLGIIGYHR